MSDVEDNLRKLQEQISKPSAAAAADKDMVHAALIMQCADFMIAAFVVKDLLQTVTPGLVENEAAAVFYQLMEAKKEEMLARFKRDHILQTVFKASAHTMADQTVEKVTEIEQEGYARNLLERLYQAREDMGY